MAISIPASEFGEARSLIPFITCDETQGLGQIRLVCSGGQRSWIAANEFSGGRISGGAGEPDDEYRFGLPVTVLISIDAIADLDPEADDEIVLDHDDGTFTLTGRFGHIAFDDLAHDYPVMDHLFAAPTDEMARATLHNELFWGLLRGATTQRIEGDDGSPAPGMHTLFIDDDGLAIAVETAGLGVVTTQLPAEVAGSVYLPVDSQGLLRASTFLGAEVVTVMVPTLNSEPIVLLSGDRAAWAMPQMLASRVLRRQVLATIEEEFGSLAVRATDEGSYRLVRFGHEILATLHTEADPPVLCVHSVLLRNIEASPELLREINDLNASRSLARIFHRDNQVLAEVDLPAHTLDAHELQTAVAQITGVVERVVPMLSTVIGGEQAQDPARLRRDLYRGTVIEADMPPSSTVLLSGEGALNEWPFDGPVWVLTAWNPQGLSYGPDENAHRNTVLAHKVVDSNGLFVRGRGWAVDRSHVEESLVVWGIDREVAVALGRQAGQDAIFEVDAERVHLLACFTDEVDSWPRSGHGA
jgi:hypothetical protein